MVNSPRFLGRWLGVCLPVLVLASSAPPSPSSHPPPISRSLSIDVRHREGALLYASVGSPQVLDVQQTIQRAFVAAPPGAAPSDVMRDALTVRYGTHVSESTAPMGYSLRWDPELNRWVVVCSYEASFLVDFGTLGTVAVAAEDRLRLR